ncbi:methytransferase partner Trm112 [Chloroflexota bacterium]
MKRELTDILACPICRGNLHLKVEKENNEEIATGSLYCFKCNVYYPILDSIPNLLPPDRRG